MPPKPSENGWRRRDPHLARSVQPGSTGFLFTVNPRQSDRARKEMGALVRRYVDDVLSEAVVAEAKEVEAPGKKAHRPEHQTGTSVSAGLAAELAAVAAASGAAGRSSSDDPAMRRVEATRRLVREMDTKVKGFLFFSVSRDVDDAMGPASAPTGDVEVPPQPEEVVEKGHPVVLEQPRTQQPTTTLTDKEGNGEPLVCPEEEEVDPPVGSWPVGDLDDSDERNRKYTAPENTFLSAVADAMWRDLAANPRPVAKNAYRCYPIPCSCVPTRPDVIARSAVAAAAAWREEALVGDLEQEEEGTGNVSAGAAFRHKPVAVWVHVTVRNNSGVDKEKEAIQRAVQSAFRNYPNEARDDAPAADASAEQQQPPCFLVQPFYTPTGAAMLAKERPCLTVTVLVIHSVALVSLQPSYVDRFEYNFGTVAKHSLTLSNAVVGSAVGDASQPQPPARPLDGTTATDGEG